VELPYHRRGIRPGEELRDQLLDLPLGLARGRLQKLLPILPGQVRGQLGDAGQVQAPVGQHLQEHRMLPRGAGGGDAQVGLGLREMEHLRAVRKHGR